MTRKNFDEVYPGEPVIEVQKKAGAPYAIRSQPNGTEEYEYIERIPLGTEVVEENHYYLVIKNGQVVSKRINRETPPAYDLIDDDDPNDVEQQ
jgi:hypothetical protein